MCFYPSSQFQRGTFRTVIVGAPVICKASKQLVLGCGVQQAFSVLFPSLHRLGVCYCIAVQYLMYQAVNWALGIQQKIKQANILLS